MGDESTTQAARRLGIPKAHTIPDMYRLATLQVDSHPTASVTGKLSEPVARAEVGAWSETKSNPVTV